ncbi:MAG TPA: hypothetical protein VF817_04090 [Patescibacteria group bacterium]
MPTYDLVLKTWQSTSKGKTKLNGSISIKGGEVLAEKKEASTLAELSKALRKSGYVPTTLKIEKKTCLEYTYQTSKLL